MREPSTSKFFTTDLVGSKSETKSLFRNILAATPCGSRFYLGSRILHARKFLGMNILGETKKN
jgi:hypothetical protein